jgi:Fe-Mn family superoxide dismutase
MKTLLSIILVFLSLLGIAQYTQPVLPYTYSELEPYIDAATMEIHYGKHHKAYVDNLNKTVVGSGMEKMQLYDLIAKIDGETPVAIRNNAGGAWNHTFFWNCMAPKAGGEPTGEIGAAIIAKWGTYDAFKAEFKKAALGQFGSGWAWLVFTGGALEIVATPNQDNPLMAASAVKGTPLLCIDVWEHAYYLKYKNKRGDYIDNFWFVVNWPKVESRYLEVK